MYKHIIAQGHNKHTHTHTHTQLASVVEVFDFETELWERKTTSGTPPSGLYNTAYTTIGKNDDA